MLEMISALNIPFLQLICDDNTQLNLNTTKNLFHQSQTSIIEIILFGKQCNLEYRGLNEYLKIDLIKQNEGLKRLFVHENRNLTISIEHFTESQKHNTYFNRKLYIGQKGEIKNAPECEISFDFIQDIKTVEELKEIISLPDFQRYWFVKKDNCDVCKDCEFRYICIDNRLPKYKSSGTWYFEKECNYNPYIGMWKEDIGYKTLQECGVVSTNESFSLDKNKIAQINKEIWGE